MPQALWAAVGSLFIGLSLWSALISFHADNPKERFYAALYAASAAFLFWLAR